jgi:hypothetical protein
MESRWFGAETRTSVDGIQLYINAEVYKCAASLNKHDTSDKYGDGS